MSGAGRPKGSKQAAPTKAEKRQYLMTLREKAMRGDTAAITALLACSPRSEQEARS
ncbi:hypothetical protein OW493_17120 [Cobetia sp. 14N.309.X.WAT.E.A4]|uniref:hypothetical protein n=1 Tax=Cobetia sp. 14N.309.X.WAT.E.A4 TaxID=2998323 RepID=UPI0025B17B39|nr:hypothetical protein [Cobetia sp. 14N.309.X.WAT.E.A4]MDN2658164.1 hypothetical protein [Cobetia sp. 14N.309.X.WAT.E.A4]